MTINPKAISWFESRAIDPEVVARLGIYSVTHDGAAGGGVTPSLRGTILAFPFMEGGEEVNTKYRGPGKKFWQRTGARSTFFNSDIIDDPAVIAGDYPLVITEGEMDTLAVMTAGFPFSMSVPDGAKGCTPRDAQGNLIDIPENADDIEVGKDAEAFKFYENNYKRLLHVKRFVLATDSDEPGWALAQQLARRLGRARCSFVKYPPGDVVKDDKTGAMRPCKDFNEVLQHHGPQVVTSTILAAKRFPVKGLYKLSEFPEHPPLVTYSTGFRELDLEPGKPGLMLYPGAFVVVSGLPGGGKTAWTTQLAFNMAKIHGWRTTIASFEMHVTPTLRDMLRAFHINWDLPDADGVPKDRWSNEDKRNADAFIEEYFSFIALDPRDEDTDTDVDWLIDRAADSVVRHGTEMLIVDPWNEVEHKRKGNETTADYTNRAIRSFKRFARSYDVCTCIVAHPTKDGAKSAKDSGRVSLVDISDGMAWANKAELGVIVSRKSDLDLITEIGIRKVKFRGTGRIGDTHLDYNETHEAFVTRRL